jgi:sensor histidine kinase YesM
MGERLRFSVQADDALLALEFPPTIVGTLIENAIKHGLEPSKTGGSIDVRAWHEGSGLVVEVADTGIGFSASAGSGVGLANARERLVMLYGPTAELDLSLNQLTGVVARARIPGALPPPAAAASTATPTGRDDSTTASTAADILT